MSGGERGQQGRGDIGWPLRRAANLCGDDVAVVDGARSVTYAELDRRVGALRCALDELGVSPEGRIGFLGANSLAHLECWIGVPSAGRSLVSLNFRLAPAELAFIANDCGLELLIVDHAQLETGRALEAQVKTLRGLVLDDAGEPPADCIAYEQLVTRKPSAARELDGQALAAISYTGGTTGAPKGVMLSHENLLANARHNLIATKHSHADRWLHVCPMFHVAGTANIFACTWVGAQQIVLPRFDATAVLAAVERHQVTHTVLVPTMLAMLIDALEQAQDTQLPSLRHIQYAASPISPALQRRVLERFECDIAQFYGMTEAAPTVTELSAEDHRRGFSGEEPYASRLSGIGAPVVGVETEVRGIDGAGLGPGEIGELHVRGPNVMLGYWNRPEETRAALINGWYRTGDAARADTDGYLYVVDRLKDMIISGGENVYSVEVEAALLEHEAVAEAAVFAIPHSRWGEAVHAVVATKPGRAVEEAELIEHCRALIAGYKVPGSIELRSEPLPKSGAGKLLKGKLRDPYWAGHDRRVS
ncbi:MAG: long-chain-fatty-acid--CoA ligase [Solirubrobacteraceae bacterium]